MPSTEWPEKTDFRGLRLKVQPVDDAPDIPSEFIPNFVLTTEGFREQLLVLGEFFPEDIEEVENQKHRFGNDFYEN